MSRAVVSLAPGQAGFYDEISGIHLSLEQKEVSIQENVNIEGLKQAVKDGRITVVSGSLDSFEAIAVNEAEEFLPTYYRLMEMKKRQALRDAMTRKQTEVKKEVITPIIEEVKQEAIIEEFVEKKIEVPVTKTKKQVAKKQTKEA